MEYLRKNNLVFVRLFRGEDAFASLVTLAEDHSWKCGFVSGIGAIENIELGAYDLENKKYIKKKFDGIHELTVLQGNFCILDGRPFFHLHGMISDHECRAWGGHFFDFQVAVTCEIKIELFDREVTREFDDELGLNLIKFCDQ